MTGSESSPSVNGPSTIKVLLVDDEVDFVNYMAKRLRARGMEVRAAHDAESAIRVVERHPVDVIVLDLLMPKTDGLEALRAFKAIRADVPVIMISGHGNEDAAEEGKRHGAAEYLLKPCDFNTLCQTIERFASS